MSAADQFPQQLIDRFLKGVDLVAPEHTNNNLPEYIDYIKYWFGTNQGGPKELKGYYLYPGFEPETAQYAYDKLEMNSRDLLIATYPKTGTNWVYAILNHIVGRREPELLQKRLDISQLFYYMESGPISKYKVSENFPFERRVFGTHLPAPLVNLKKFREKGVKLIYVIRNPKDQAVSWYNFMMSHPQSKSAYWKPILPADEKEFYDLYFAGKQFVLAKKGEGYLETVREWYEHRNDENVLFIVFEKIKKDPRGEIRKLSDFIGESLSEAELDWVVEKTSFRSMKKKVEESGSEQSGVQLIRKGQVGDWKNHLTVAQSELVDRKVKQILGDTDIEFIYE